MKKVKMQVKPGKVIKLRYCHLPVQNLSYEVMVQQIEPIRCIQKIESFNHIEMLGNNNSVDELLKERVLEQWHSQLSINQGVYGENIPPELVWMTEVDSVELIECDLLVPIGK